MFKRPFLYLFCFFLSFICFNKNGEAQRNYAPNSVLATGNWYKIGVIKQGIYRLDVAFFNSLGINTSNISSSSIRLYGNGGLMLPENNVANRPDDLVENAIEIVDGGDGLFNGNDYLLFYGALADKWLKDSLNNKFLHQKNLFTDTVYYYLSIGGVGKRIQTKNITAPANKFVTSYNERFFQETEAINFLNSGKDWFGEEFSNLPGNSLNQSFPFNIIGLDQATPINLTVNLAVRSIGNSSSFNVSINNVALPNIQFGAVSGNYLDAFATSVNQGYNFNSTTNQLNVGFSFAPSSSAAQGWLNWFELHARRSLNMNNNTQVFFRDWQSVGSTNIASFSIQGATNSTLVWDITSELEPQKLATTHLLGTTTFKNEANNLKEYVAFESFLTPIAIGKINNQNLHNSSVVDYLIISPPIFLPQAQRLALFHKQQYNYTTLAVNIDHIYNEFSGGNPDPTAIRDFVKMYYDKAGTDTTKRPKYLLLFGAASFDYKNRIANNTNFIPCYQSNNSLDPLVTYTSDDFFGFLDNTDDINFTSPPPQLDIAIGRFPVINLNEAKNMVDKIIAYHASSSFGPWRNNTLFVADDKDANIHLTDAELIVASANSTNKLFNQDKIYLDAFPLVSGTGGGRYPQVNEAIVNKIFNGALLFNYSGHGGYQRLADEAILSNSEVNQFNNANKLPLFITATCDFAPYDDPTKASIGAYTLAATNKGAIALVTTTRVVFAFSNRIINDNFIKILLKKTPQQDYLTLGEAVKNAKNITYATFSDINNNRKFTLLGDPAIKLAFPKLNIELTEINGNINFNNDTLKALSKYTFKGKVTQLNGSTASNFNGTIYPIIFDKEQTVQTLSNNVASPLTSFKQQQNIIYKGKATVQNGLYSFSFIVPKDINYQIGNGRLSLYADNGVTDANGVNTNLLVGGNSNLINVDAIGPRMNVFLNDEKFINGGLINEQPILIVKLFDSSGINTVGTGIGHDITLTIDGDDKNTIVLNNFYEADRDNFQSGSIRFQLPVLTEGIHYLKVKAWDVANNSSEKIIEFTVAASKSLQISRVLNYPNPFTSNTAFWFEHNQVNGDLKVLINIFSVTGKLVHQIQRNIPVLGNRVCEIFWDGKDKYSEKLAKGVYIYRIIAVHSAGSKAEATQKLYLL